MLGVAAVDGAQATHGHFLRSMARSTIVHVASHAAFDVADPLESAMELADGAVTARDVLASPGGRLRLVTLSACESGMHAVRAGDELLGLTRAVLYAGAASVLVTPWSVDDEATAVLMRAFYDRWVNRGEPKVLALAAAQRDVIAAGYSAPDEWAPFTLIGDWL
jgi:CHAT domain-containing protein